MAMNNLSRDTQNDSDGWTLVAGFFVLVLGSFILLEIGLVPQDAEPIVLGLLFIILPLLLGLVNAVQGHTTSSSVGIGISPVVAWAIVTIGKLFLGAITTSVLVLFGYGVVIAAVGTVATLAGFAIGSLGRIAAAKYAG